MTNMKIPLTRGKFTIVSPEDYKYLSQWQWTYNGTYATRGRTTASESFVVYIHRVILVRMGNYAYSHSDHVNRDPLDNRRCNLRTATASQNLHNRGIQKNNTSGYKGVHWSKQAKKWEVRMLVNKKTIYGGLFEDIKDAARKYNQHALEYQGEFAVLNEV